MMKRSHLVAIAALTFAGASVMVVRSARQENVPARPVTALLTAHSYLYGAYENKGPKLGEDHDTTGIQLRTGHPEPLSLPEYAARRACAADAVIAGHVIDSASALTSGGHFIFTDYEVSIDEIVKQNLTAPLVIGDHIILTRAGGSVQAGTQRLRAFHDGFPELRVGSAYLLFVKYLPDTRSYQSTDSEGTFLLENGHSRHIAKFPIAIGEDVDRGAFVTAIRTMASAPCM